MKNEITNEIKTLIQKGKLPQDTLKPNKFIKNVKKHQQSIKQGNKMDEKNEKHTIRPRKKRRNKRRKTRKGINIGKKKENRNKNEITTLIQKGKLPQDTLNQIHSLKCKNNS